MIIDPFATGVLNKEDHAPLVADLTRVVMDANIEAHWVWTSLLDVGLTETEVTWVRRFKYHSTAGLCIVGRNPSITPEVRMAAIAGCLTRNFIRATVMTVSTFVDYVESGSPPDMTCVLIPNFFVERKNGASVAPWKLAGLFDGLLQRHAKGLKTVVYVPEFEAMSKQMGNATAMHLATLYDQVTIS